MTKFIAADAAPPEGDMTCAEPGAERCGDDGRRCVLPGGGGGKENTCGWKRATNHTKSVIERNAIGSTRRAATCMNWWKQSRTSFRPAPVGPSSGNITVYRTARAAQYQAPSAASAASFFSASRTTKVLPPYSVPSNFRAASTLACFV